MSCQSCTICSVCDNHFVPQLYEHDTICEDCIDRLNDEFDICSICLSKQKETKCLCFPKEVNPNEFEKYTIEEIREMCHKCKACGHQMK